MRIGIIGSGNMGKTVGYLLAQKGHEIRLGTQRVTDVKDWVDNERLDVETGTYQQAVDHAEVLFLTTSWASTHSVITSLKNLSKKILVDCTNPEDPEADHEHVLGFNTSGSEQIARLAPGARVVKAFNHLYGSMLLKGTDMNGVRASVFLCGDEAQAKEVVANLANDLELDPIDVGGLHRARLLEPMGNLIVRLASLPENNGADIAFTLLKRNHSA